MRTVEFTVGGYQPALGRYFAGGVDEAAVYSYTLDQTRIRNHYRAGAAATSTDAQILASWDNNQTSGTTVTDTSGNAKTLTLYGAPAWVDGTGPVDFGPAASAELEEIKWKSHAILVPRVHYHLKSNQTRNRVDVVEKIQKHMTANNLN